MQSKTVIAKTVGDLSIELESTINDSFQPTLAFLFIHADADIAAVQKLSFDYNFEIFGTSSGSVIGKGRVYDESLVALLLDIDPAAFRIASVEEKEIGAKQLGKSISDWLASSFQQNSPLVFVANLLLNGDDFLKGYALGKNCEEPLLGAYAANATLRAGSTFVFTKKYASRKGIIMLSFDKTRVELSATLLSGWDSIGGDKVVTHSEAGEVYEIEGQTASHFVDEYCDCMDEANQLRAQQIYPFQFQGAHGEKIVRTVVDVNSENSSLLFSGTIPEGALFRFCSPNPVATINKAIAQLHKYKENEDPKDVDAMLLFSAHSRKSLFGLMSDYEVGRAFDLLGLAGAGFYSFAEIGSENSTASRFTNGSISVLLIKDLVNGSGKKLSATALAPNEEKATFQKLIERTLADISSEEAPLLLKSTLRQNLDEKRRVAAFYDKMYQEQNYQISELKRLRRKPQETSSTEQKMNNDHTAARHESITVLSCQIEGLKQISIQREPIELVASINSLYTKFDKLVESAGLQKVAGRAASYIVVGGIDTAKSGAAVMLELAQKLVKTAKAENAQTGAGLEVKVGLHTGLVTLGVLSGSLQAWGQAVDLAERIGALSESGKIHVSEVTRQLLDENPTLRKRGEINVKGSGRLSTFYV